MLTGAIEDSDRYAPLNMFMRDLKRVHVSRYPLEVISRRRDQVFIYDTRFMEKPVLSLTAVGGDTYKIWSPLIQNEKYSRNNSEYNTRKTTDLAKIRRWLKEYAVPLSTEFIVRNSYRIMTNKMYVWKKQYESEIQDLVGDLKNGDVIADILNYVKTGVAYQSVKFDKLKSEEFLDKVEQQLYRAKVDNPPLHVLVNPDDLVCVSTMTQTWNDPEHICTQQYDALETDYRSKIALLKTAPPNTVLDQVGLRIDTCNFWIYK